MSIRISFGLLLKAVFIALGIFLIYNISLKILGGSLSKEDIIIVMLSALFVYIFHLTKEVSYLRGEFSQFKNIFKSLSHDFKMLAKDFQEHQVNHKR